MFVNNRPKASYSKTHLRPEAVLVARVQPLAHARGVRHGVRQEVLLVVAREQVRPWAPREHRHVLAAVRLARHRDQRRVRVIWVLWKY
jgi:hypothetical protein